MNRPIRKSLATSAKVLARAAVLAVEMLVVALAVLAPGRSLTS